MARLGIDKAFLSDFAKLERAVQQKVTEVFAKFEDATHTGLHLEKIAHANDPRFRTVRIDQFWRGVVLAPTIGDTYTLLKVLPHDDAYQWAKRRAATVNAAVGCIEIRDVTAIDATLPELSKLADRVETRLFDDVSDADLRRLGIDDQTLAFARALTHPVQLDASRAFLPETQWDALYGLAAGISVEEVWAEIAAGQSGGGPAAGIDVTDVEAAVERSTRRVVLVDGPDELMKVFEHPFALWRVYLHPTQQQVVQARYRGPARVTGGPGTGKTVVALHRARQLAEQGDGPVLLTTFTSTLGASLQAGLRLLTESSDVLGRIVVRHVDQLANEVFTAARGRPKILGGAEQLALWRSVVSRGRFPFTATFLADEWRHVVLAQGLSTLDHYQAASRAGRGRRLGTRQRDQVWQAMVEFQQALGSRSVWTYETVCAEATRLLEAGFERPYRHAVVDEAQDLSPPQWRLLRAAVKPGPDDLFVAGDTHQRIYDNRVSLREVGIHVAGRSTRLTVNYRTTAEILAWSLGMLRGEQVDDMDGGLDTVAGYRSEVHGRLPELAGYPSRDEELRAVAERVRGWVNAGVVPGEIGVAARSNKLAEAVVPYLAQVGVPARLLAKAASASASDADSSVYVGTMHRMKGLEFRCLAVVGVSNHAVPGPVVSASDDPIGHERGLQRERCVLFVACTRAREQLAVTWHGAPSAFLPGRA